MSQHSLEFAQTACLNCSNHSIPFRGDFKCHYCGRAIDVYYDFVICEGEVTITHFD